MDNLLRNSIEAALAEWEKLDDWHKGEGFERSETRLKTWLEELDRKEKTR